MFLAQTSGGGSPIVLLLLLGMPVMLFVMMRSQRKKAAQQQNLQRSAGVGSEIMTTAGIFGTIVDEDEDEGTIVLEIAPGTQIKLIRGAIARVVDEDDSESEEYDDDEDADEDDDAVVDLADAEHEPSAADADNAEGPFRS
ncbi:MAG TPA: preprotein translocase subunit YajC [Actinomycetota bacterium]|jgi:preprotein translocase subunit YajC|nr:preprotein translocase subunit YajC [Actinomycetota bacterium]